MHNVSKNTHPTSAANSIPISVDEIWGMAHKNIMKTTPAADLRASCQTSPRVRPCCQSSNHSSMPWVKNLSYQNCMDSHHPRIFGVTSWEKDEQHMNDTTYDLCTIVLHLEAVFHHLCFFFKKKTISTVVQMFGNPFGGLYVYDVIWFIRYYRLGCIPVPQCREVWQLIWRTLDMLQMGKYTCFASPCSGRIACVHLVFALGSVHHCLTSMCHPYTSCGMMEYTQWSLFSYTSRSIQNVGWFHSLHLW